MDGQIHHKGFLPTHDALLLGSNVKMGFVGDRVQFALHPFFGQGWIPSKHYWGTNLSLNIAPRADGMPWGSIVMGYVGGDESLTDHGRGMNLHGDVDLTNGFLFTSGIRQNSLSGNANYALVKWKASLD